MDSKRRDAIKFIATAPTGMFFLREDRAAKVEPEEALPWIAAGIVAASHLSYTPDLITADQVAASYLPTLIQITDDKDYRREAARLTTQAYTIRAVLAWHINPKNAISHGLQAEKYSILTKNPMLQAHTLRIVAMAYFYGRNYQAAMQKMLKTQEIINNNPVPNAMKSWVYVELAKYQGYHGLIDESRETMKLFYKYRSVQKIHGIGGYESEHTLRRQEGEALAARALHHSNKQEAKALHSAALECYEQSGQTTNIYGERHRIELLNNTLISMLS